MKLTLVIQMHKNIFRIQDHTKECLEKAENLF